MKPKLFLLIVAIFIVYLCLFYTFFEVWTSGATKKKSSEILASVTLPYVVLHIDLKGSPPKLEYLQSLFPTLKKFGVNALLMEYEDMFPYEGKLVNISARNCYNKSELKEFLYVASQSGFEIIPLIQTFGHVEHVLKLEEFSHLRENPLFPDSLCPSRQESKELIELMLKQVVEFHSNVVPLKHIHVGCDEVYHINECPKCTVINIPNVNIFVDHVVYVSSLLKDLSPYTTMLIWDDMLRSVNPIDSADIKCFENVEPVYWDYNSIPKIAHRSLFLYRKKFKNIWTATAFKGADGATASLPLLGNRAQNHFKWMDMMLNYKFAGETKVFDFKGMILTGWSRYSHMDPPCELLPASYPSLILSLLIIQRFRLGVPVLNDGVERLIDGFYAEYIEKSFKEALGCKSDIKINNIDALVCDFEGHSLYNKLQYYNKIMRNLSVNLNLRHLLSFEYSHLSKVNINKLVENIVWCNSTLLSLDKFDLQLGEELKPYYEDEVVREYIFYKTFSVKKKLTVILDKMFNLLYVQNWQRNPINYYITNVTTIKLH